MLLKCILQPLTPGLEEFVKTDKLGAELREKAFQKLSDTLSKNDDTLWTWEKTIRDEFQDLYRWISSYTIGYGVSAELTQEEAINQKLLKQGLEQRDLENLIHIDPQEWQDYKQEYEKEMEEERKKNALAMQAEGFDNNLIAKCLGITEEEVEKLLKE
ncbi:MAG: hypothetical protein IJS10_03490 [Alphaproteobacteria bacterium]|nr:hypothetical protein [Alphaproteobacteria bacterium]